MLRATICCLLLLLAATAGIPASTAQAPAANPPPPSPTNNVLWAHHHDSDTAELTGWLNTLQVDPGANDVALGPGDPVTTRTLTLTSAPANTGVTELDPAGNIVVTAYIGGGTTAGVVRVSTELTYGGEELASGSAQNHAMAPSSAQYGVLTWTLAPAFTTLPAGGQFVWTVSMTGAAAVAYLGVSEDRGKSNIALPILSTTAPEPGAEGGNITYHNVTEVKVDAAHSFTAAENSTHVYNWTTNLTEVEILVTGDAVAGFANVTVVDAANATIFARSVGLNVTNSTQTEFQGEPGNWTIRIEFDAFVGNLTVKVHAPAQAVPMPPPGGTGNETDDGNGTKGNGKGSPGPALPVLLTLLAVLAVVVRRRT